jgi:two-component system KDP operon response regulator KdpE
MTDRIALAVDDAPANRDFLDRLLTGAKFKVQAVGTGHAALHVVSEIDQLELAVIDMKLPDMPGLELAAELRKRFPKLCIVMATMYDERSIMEEAFTAGCNVFLVKPHGFMELFQRLMTSSVAEIRDGPKLVIDQYGPRVFKAATQQMPKVQADPNTKS